MEDYDALVSYCNDCVMRHTALDLTRGSQTFYGSIVGVVADSSGSVLQGAS